MSFKFQQIESNKLFFTIEQKIVTCYIFLTIKKDHYTLVFEN